MREQIASVLHRAGALRTVMHLRRIAPVQTLSIVTYHHVTPDDPRYRFDPAISDATPEQFRRQIELLARYGTPITIAQLVRALEGEPLPKNPVMVTFDDGYLSCHDIALPILREVGVPATFFVSTSFITERRLYWWERISLLVQHARRARVTLRYPEPREIDIAAHDVRTQLCLIVKNTPDLVIEQFLQELATLLEVEWSEAIETQYANELIMTWDQVTALARAGMDVESHGRTHRVLQTLSMAELDRELAGSRAELETRLGRTVTAIAYPVGRRISRDPRIRAALTNAGYRVGFTNMSGVNRMWPLGVRPIDRFDVRRLATDRGMGDGMFLSQIAIPVFAYIAKANRD